MKHWDAFYQYLAPHGLAKKAVLEGLSRGGLYCFNWAAANPDKVACIYADNAVLDFKSWPAGKGKSKGSPADWKKLIADYHFASEAEALAYDKNPIDNLAPLAKAKIPLFHLCGDSDTVVPYEENTAIVKERYEKLGGPITVMMKKGMDHHPHGLGRSDADCGVHCETCRTVRLLMDALREAVRAAGRAGGGASGGRTGLPRLAAQVEERRPLCVISGTLLPFRGVWDRLSVTTLELAAFTHGFETGATLPGLVTQSDADNGTGPAAPSRFQSSAACMRSGRSGAGSTFATPRARNGSRRRTRCFMRG